MKKAVTILFFLITALVIAIALTPTNKEQTAKTCQMQQDDNQANWLIKANEHGNAYPYTKDDLIIMCQADAVWLEDENANKYALNGIAKSFLKNDKKYQGSTEKILKPGSVDLYTPDQAQKICIRIGQ